MVSQASVDFRGALSRPFVKIGECLRECEKNLSAAEAANMFSTARREIAKITNLHHPDRIVFGRNTTDALSFVRPLARTEQGEVLLSDAEYSSVVRIFHGDYDHGNTRREDPLTTWSDDLVKEAWSGSLPRRTDGNPTRPRIVPFLYDYDIEALLDKVSSKTRLVLVSHAVRSTGRVIDIARLARLLKERAPRVMLAVDGAFAFGNLPHLNFASLEAAGVDFYGISPHKTLKTYPLGIMLVSGRAARRLPLLGNLSNSLIFQHMISPAYGEVSNVSEGLNPNRARALVVALDEMRRLGLLNSGDFTARLARAARLKKKLLEGLNLASDALLSRDAPDYLDNMLVFRAPSGSSREAVARLAALGVYCCYIPETDALRVCVDIEHDQDAVDRFVLAWRALYGRIPALPKKEPSHV